MSSTIGISNATTVRDQRETQRRLGEHRSWEVMKNLDEEILGEESQHLDHLELSIYIPKWMRFLKPRPFIHQCIVKKQALPAWHQNRPFPRGLLRTRFCFKLRQVLLLLLRCFGGTTEPRHCIEKLKAHRETSLALPLPCPPMK